MPLPRTPIPLLPPGPEAELIRKTALWPTQSIPLTAAELEPLDQSKLLTLAREHRLLPPLFGAVNAAGLAGLWPQLQAAAQRQTLHALKQAATTRHLLTLFEQAGCRALVLKGQALSLQLYGRADLRMSSDIDFLIDPAAILKAHQVLVENGYEPYYPVPIEKLLRVNKDQVYFFGNIRIENHCRLFDNSAFLPWSFEYLWSNRSFISLMQSQEVPTLARNHHIFYQALHGLRHGWRRLRWLVDLAIPLQNKTDVTDLYELAEKYNFGSSLLHTALLSEEIFNIKTQLETISKREHFISAMTIRSNIKNLAEIRISERDNKFSEWVFQRFFEKKLDFYISPNIKSIIIELKKCFIGIGDLIDTNLPRRLFWLYPFLRPFLLMRRVLDRYRKRRSS